MIIILDALNRCDFEDVMREVHALRARVFQGRLGWDVTVEDGLEIDAFDALDPAHVVSLDDRGRVVGCMRLLQTTGPHMLSDVFHPILDGEPPLRSPHIWEATRFCVDTDRLDRGRGRNSVSYVTSEVMLGAFEYAMSAGVTDAVAVIDPVMNRLMKRSGNAPHGYLGSAKQMGVVKAMAALMDASPERVASIRAFAGIEGDVFGTEDEVRALFDSGKVQRRRTGAAPVVDTPAHDAFTALVSYCRDQLALAQSDEDRAAAMELVREIVGAQSQADQERLRAALQAAA